MKNLQKEAMRDAAESAAALMSYGEGAGIRRRHIETAVNFKGARIPGYTEAYTKAMAEVDMTKAIKGAQRSGKARDIGAMTSKNVKALARGDKASMSTPVILAVVGLGIAHQTGYDKKAWAYSKRKSQDVRSWLKRKL